jgi:hypothetical protein
VYCSGIDPSIVQLDYVSISETDNYKSWTKSNVYYNHTHDVRNILIANNQLISAGVDTKIVFKNIKDKQSHSLIRKYNSMPQKPLVDTCDDFVLLQYERHLELWKLGQTAGEVDLAEKKNGDCLAILRSPKKYAHIKSKNDLHIVCSSLGSHPGNKASSQNHIIWLSYSDLNVIHIYRIEISSKELLEPKIKIDKIKSLPLACGNRPAVLIKFQLYFNEKTNESSMLANGSPLPQLRLYYLTNKSCLQCLKLVNDGFMLECSIQCIQQGDLVEHFILFDLREKYVYRNCLQFLFRNKPNYPLQFKTNFLFHLIGVIFSWFSWLTLFLLIF